jgi:hypothetical protein
MPPTKQSAQVAASRKAAATKASNAARARAAALISTPGLTAGEAPPAVFAHHDHDDEHVHGARAPPERRAVVHAPLRTCVRFRDLKAAGVVDNWTQLRRLIDTEGFPAGRYAGKNTRIWTAAEIEAWLDSRPQAVEREQAAERAAV